jgi:cytochrome P450
MPEHQSRCPIAKPVREPVATPFTEPQRLLDDLAESRTAPGLPWSEALGAYVVTRYDDVVAALHDSRTFSSRPTVPDLPSPWPERFAGLVPARGTLIGVDNPDHDRLRASVNTFFMPQRLLDLHEYLRGLMDERRTDRRDDLISHISDLRDAGLVDMTDFERLSMIPGLMLAGHETSSNVRARAPRLGVEGPRAPGRTDDHDLRVALPRQSARARPLTSGRHQPKQHAHWCP